MFPLRQRRMLKSRTLPPMRSLLSLSAPSQTFLLLEAGTTMSAASVLFVRIYLLMTDDSHRCEYMKWGRMARRKERPCMGTRGRFCQFVGIKCVALLKSSRRDSSTSRSTGREQDHLWWWRQCCTYLRYSNRADTASRSARRTDQGRQMARDAPRQHSRHRLVGQNNQGSSRSTLFYSSLGSDVRSSCTIVVLGYAHIKPSLDSSATRALLHPRRFVPTHGSRHR